MAEANIEKIRQRAYEIWQEEGCPEGQDERHWRAAEAEMAGDAAGAAVRKDVIAPLPELPRPHSSRRRRLAT